MVDLVVTKAVADFSRWSLRHHIYKDDRTIAAVLTMDGAWIDMTKRKLAIPNEFIQRVFENFPRADDFLWQTPK
jgi:acyl-CoA thioester hydrolase